MTHVSQRVQDKIDELEIYHRIFLIDRLVFERNTKEVRAIGAMEKAPPLRILCIHGYRQNSASFRQKLGAFRKACGKRAEYVFIDAPHAVPTKKEEQEETGADDKVEDKNGEELGWWFSAEVRDGYNPIWRL